MRTDRHEQEYWSLPPNCSAHIYEWLKKKRTRGCANILAAEKEESDEDMGFGLFD